MTLLPLTVMMAWLHGYKACSTSVYGGTFILLPLIVMMAWLGGLQVKSYIGHQGQQLAIARVLKGVLHDTAVMHK